MFGSFLTKPRNVFFKMHLLIDSKKKFKLNNKENSRYFQSSTFTVGL